MDISSYRCDNYKSVMYGEAFDYVNDLILQEIAEDKYIIALTPPHCVHSLGAVPKDDGSYRQIADCNRPLGLSINNFKDTTFHEFSYCTTDQVYANMKSSCYMATVNISAA